MCVLLDMPVNLFIYSYPHISKRKNVYYVELSWGFILVYLNKINVTYEVLFFLVCVYGIHI